MQDTRQNRLRHLRLINLQLLLNLSSPKQPLDQNRRARATTSTTTPSTTTLEITAPIDDANEETDENDITPRYNNTFVDIDHDVSGQTALRLHLVP